MQGYDAVLDSLRSGDLVFCSGSYLFSGLIQRFTKSVWSQVGVIYRDENLGRVFVLESEVGVGVGVRRVPVSKDLRDYHGRRRPYRGQIVVGRLRPALTVDPVRQGVSFGMDLLTRPDDNNEILRIAMRIAFRVGRRARDRKFICSELVEELLPRRRRALHPPRQRHPAAGHLAQRHGGAGGADSLAPARSRVRRARRPALGMPCRQAVPSAPSAPPAPAGPRGVGALTSRRSSARRRPRG